MLLKLIMMLIDPFIRLFSSEAGGAERSNRKTKKRIMDIISPRYLFFGLFYEPQPSSQQMHSRLALLKKEDPEQVLQLLMIQAQDTHHPFGPSLVYYHFADATQQFIALLKEFAGKYPKQVLSLLMTKNCYFVYSYRATFGNFATFHKGVKTTEEYIKLLMQLALVHPEKVLALLMLKARQSERDGLFFDLSFGHVLLIKQEAAIKKYFELLEQLALHYPQQVLGLLRIESRNCKISMAYTQNYFFSFTFSEYLAAKGNAETIQSFLVMLQNILELGAYPSTIAVSLTKFTQNLEERPADCPLSDMDRAIINSKIEEINRSVEETIDQYSTMLQTELYPQLRRLEHLDQELEKDLDRLIEEDEDKQEQEIRLILKIDDRERPSFSQQLIDNVLAGIKDTLSDIDQIAEGIIDESIKRLACLKVLALVLSISKKLINTSIPDELITELVVLFPRATVGYKSIEEEDKLLDEIRQRLFDFHIERQLIMHLDQRTLYKELCNEMIMKDKVSSENLAKDRLLSLYYYNNLDHEIPKEKAKALDDEIKQYSPENRKEQLYKILRPEHKFLQKLQEEEEHEGNEEEYKGITFFH